MKTFIQEKCEEIMRSIAYSPCTLQELTKREFLDGFSEYSVWTFLTMSYCRDMWYEDKKDVLHVYAKYKEDVMNG